MAIGRLRLVAAAHLIFDYPTASALAECPGQALAANTNHPTTRVFGSRRKMIHSFDAPGLPNALLLSAGQPEESLIGRTVSDEVIDSAGSLKLLSAGAR